jgi:hypothetical protein
MTVAIYDERKAEYAENKEYQISEANYTACYFNKVLSHLALGLYTIKQNKFEVWDYLTSKRIVFSHDSDEVV